MTIQSILDDSYFEIDDKLSMQKSEIYYSIIQIKKENREHSGLQQSLYKDIKGFIINYIESVEEKDFGYDFINIDKIINAIDTEISPNARFELYSFSIRLLKSMNHDDLITGLLRKRTFARFQLTLCEKSFLSNIRAILIISSYNFVSIFLSLILLSLVALLLEQNSFLSFFELFKFENEPFTKNELLNQFLNILAMPLGLAENFKIIPLNVFAVFLLIILRCLYLVLVVNFMFSKINDNLIR